MRQAQLTGPSIGGRKVQLQQATVFVHNSKQTKVSTDTVFALRLHTQLINLTLPTMKNHMPQQVNACVLMCASRSVYNYAPRSMLRRRCVRELINNCCNDKFQPQLHNSMQIVTYLDLDLYIKPHPATTSSLLKRFIAVY